MSLVVRVVTRAEGTDRRGKLARRAERASLCDPIHWSGKGRATGLGITSPTLLSAWAEITRIVFLPSISRLV